MAAVLLIRSITDISFALMAVNEFLAYRRSGGRLNDDDEILAVCLKGDLDAGLTIWRFSDGEFGCAPAGTPATCGTQLTRAGLALRESFSLSGIWTLCWVDGPLLRRARSAGARREAILRMLVHALSSLGLSTERGAVFPVFGADEATESVEAEVGNLQARYPSLIGSNWYRDDRTCGIVAVEPL